MSAQKGPYTAHLGFFLLGRCFLTFLQVVGLQVSLVTCLLNLQVLQTTLQKACQEKEVDNSLRPFLLVSKKEFWGSISDFVA